MVFGRYKLRHLDKWGNGVYEKISVPGKIRYICRNAEYEYVKPIASDHGRNGIKDIQMCIFLEKNDANHWTVRLKICFF